MKRILLIISFLSISNFVFSAEKEEQKKGQKEKEVTVQEAYDAIINNKVQTVARFLNQKTDNLIARDPIYNELLFIQALFHGRLEIIELFLMKGILKLLDQDDTVTSIVAFLRNLKSPHNEKIQKQF